MYVYIQYIGYFVELYTKLIFLTTIITQIIVKRQYQSILLKGIAAKSNFKYNGYQFDAPEIL